MKSNIHPNWHNDTKVTCSCGNTFVTGSALEEIQVDICSQCHPFFTGEMKFVDQQGRVDRFKKQMEQAQQKKQKSQQKLEEKKQTQQTKQEQPLSYQEILREKQSQLREDKKAN
jgi:large subunit ribosomal protein L31